MPGQYQFRLGSITFNNGTKAPLSDLTVLVGPNNSGKSQALKDIVELTTKELSKQRTVVVHEIDADLPDSIESLQHAYPFVNRVRDSNGNWMYHGLQPTLVGQHTVSGGAPPEESRSFASNERLLAHGWFWKQFGVALVSFITTEHRLQLVKESESSSHDHATANLLQAFYNAGSATEKDVSSQVSSVFHGQQIALDYTTLTRLRLRIAESFDDVPPDPRDAKAAMNAKATLDSQGDGIRSFTGMVVALKTANRPLILIDEPEAFLHPPQAYAMGRFIASESQKGRQIVVATHSTDVLRGVLSATKQAEIIRVSRLGDTNTFLQITRETLNSITSDPLLSSARVLDALFYQSAVVTEADADARFFHAALQKSHDHNSCHVVNASNKQTVTKIMQIYQSLGVRRAGIVDFDILRKQEEWHESLKSIGLEEQQIAEVQPIRDAIAEFAKQAPASGRLSQVAEILSQVNLLISEYEGAESDDSPDDSQELAASKILGQIEKRLQEAAHVTKPWKELKQIGRNAFPEQLRSDFDKLWSVVASLRRAAFSSFRPVNWSRYWMTTGFPTPPTKNNGSSRRSNCCPVLQSNQAKSSGNSSVLSLSISVLPRRSNRRNRVCTRADQRSRNE